MRFLWRLFWRSSLLILLLVLALLVFVLGTQTGLRTALEGLDRYLPNAVRYESITGVLFDHLKIDGLEARFGAFELDVGEFEFDWEASELLSGHLLIEQLRIAQIRLKLPDPTEEPPPSTERIELSDISLPIDVTLQLLHIEEFILDQPEPVSDFELNDLQLALHSEENNLILDRLSVQIPQLYTDAKGQITPQDNYPMDLALNWQYDEPNYGQFTGQAVLTGELAKELTINHQLKGAISADLNAQLAQVLNDPAWNIELNASSSDLGIFVPELHNSPLQLQLNSTGNLENFNATGQARTNAPEVGPVQALFNLEGGLQGKQYIKLQSLRLLADEHPMRFGLSADVDLASQMVTANGDWQALAWPLSGQPQFASPRGRLQVSGTLDNFQAELEAALQGEQLSELQTALSAQGSTTAIDAFQLKLFEPRGDLALNINGSAQLDDLSVQAEADWQQLRWPLKKASESAQVISPKGKLQVSGGLDAYQANLSAEIDGSQFELLDASAELQGDLQQLKIESLQVKARDSDLQLAATAEVALATLDFKATGEWQQLSWPMKNATGAAQYQSEQGSFQAEGNLQEYNFNLQTEVDGEAIPTGAWKINGTGSATELSALTVQGETLGGTLQAAAQASWQPSIAWQANLSGNNINPGVKWPEVSGELNFALQSQGQMEQGLVQAAAQLSQLQGELNGQPVQGSADVSVAGTDVMVHQLDIKAGSAQLQADGEVAEQWNLDWQLNVPELASLLPDAGGSVQGQGTISGNASQPKAQATLSARQLKFADTTLAQLDSTITLDLQANSNIKLSAQDLNTGGQQISRINIDGQGTLDNHSLNLTVQTAEFGSVETALKGALEDTQWQGQLSQLRLQQTPAGDWQLAQAVPIEASAEQADLGQLCLQSNPSALCLQGNWSATQGGTAEVELEQLNLNRFAEFLPKTITLSNNLDADLSAQLGSNGAINGNAEINLSQGEVTILADGRLIKLNISGGAITAQSDGQNAQSKVALDLGTLGSLQGNAAVQNLTQTPQIQANVQAQINDFSIASKLVPTVQDLEGRLRVDISANGTLPTPNITGEVVLEDAAVAIPETGTQIEDIQLQTASSDGNTLRFNGSARSGEGQIQLEGSLQPFERRAEINIQGKDFLAVDSFSQMLISPDLQISIADGQVQANGSITIPSAQLSPPATGRSRISASSDVVIVKNEPDAEEELSPASELFAKLRVILGDDVWVNTDVFTAQLKGAIEVTQTPQLSPRASGSLEVAAGTYTIYGQDLIIERGRVLFGGGPVDNPGLDMRIARQFENDGEDITVGAQVRGSAKQPTLDLFSVPPMLESDIVSYLVFGRPASGSGGESQLLYQAAAALGASRTGGVTDELSEELGVDLSLESGDTLEETELVIGKYLTPDLYVSYGVGLFEAVNTFNLTYQINKWLTLDATSSGSDSSADLLYTIER